MFIASEIKIMPTFSNYAENCSNAFSMMPFSSTHSIYTSKLILIKSIKIRHFRG